MKTTDARLEALSAVASHLNASILAGESASQFAARLDAVLAAMPADPQARAKLFGLARNPIAGA